MHACAVVNSMFLSVFLPTFSRADINNIFTVIMRVSHHGTLQPGHVGWVKVSRLTVSISGKNSGKTQGILKWIPCGYPESGNGWI